MRDTAYWLGWLTSEWCRVLPPVFVGTVLGQLTVVGVLVAVANWADKRRKR